MNAERNAYLREMGIDIYLPRDQLAQNIRPVQPLSARRLTTVDTALASPVPQPGAPQPAAPQPAAPRPATPQPATPQPATPQPATPQPAAPQPAAQEQRPTFLLSLLTYPAASLGLSLAIYQPGSQQTLSAQGRSFADAVAASYLKSRQTGETVLTEVRWPMVQSNAIPQTRAEARVVVQDKLVNCQSILLVFGADAMPYLLPEPLLSLPVGPGVPLTWESRQIWQVPSLNDCLASADAKRAVWRVLAGIIADTGYR